MSLYLEIDTLLRKADKAFNTLNVEKSVEL